MGVIVDIVEDIGGAIVDVVEDVIGVVGDAVDWVVDEIVEPVLNGVGDIVQAALDDPITTLSGMVKGNGLVDTIQKNIKGLSWKRWTWIN